METNVWGRHLPDEILYTILAHLPVSSFCRMRSVCKKWNAIGQDPGFWKIISGLPSPPPFWIVYTLDEILVFDSTSSTWHVASSFIADSDRRSVIDASESLLLIMDHEQIGGPFSVFNPLNKTSRRIPEMDNWAIERCRKFGFVMNKETEGFKVYAVDEGRCGQEILKMQVFDSVENKWEMSGSLMRGKEQEVFNHEVLDATYHKGSLYCLTEASSPDNEGFRGINYRVYRVGPEAWEEILAPMPSRDFFPHLFEKEGRLLLGGGRVADYDTLKLQSVQLWELDSVHSKWVEILHMPSELVKDLASFVDFTFVASGDYIGVGSYDGRANRFICDITKSSWRSLPSHSQNIHQRQIEEDEVFGTFLFQPRWDVVLKDC